MAIIKYIVFSVGRATAVLSDFFAYCQAWILTHSFKGRKGEIKVSGILSLLPRNNYILLNDLLLPINEEGHTIQIDHVVVSSYGVFVIETKNYSGTIYGTEKKEYWSQYLGHKMCEFRNPILQNNAHVKCLQKMFVQFGDIHLIPIVVFVGDAKLKVKTQSSVVSGLVSLVYEVIRHRTYYLMPLQQTYIVNCLELCNLSSTINNYEHRKVAIQKAERAKQRILEGRCPRCGGMLVPRHGKYGEFIGCENYPNCRYTVNL